MVALAESVLKIEDLAVEDKLFILLSSYYVRNCVTLTDMFYTVFIS